MSILNIPENQDILTEIYTVGDTMDFSDQIIDDSIDTLLEDIEGCYMDSYYHEDFV